MSGEARDELLISIVIPAHNEGDRLKGTLCALEDAATGLRPLEFVICDDASDPPVESLTDGRELRSTVRVCRSDVRCGVARARNRAAAESRGDVLVMTDAHVEFSPGWDALVDYCFDEPVVFAGTVVDTSSRFRAYGCTLVVPFMGTRWNRVVLPPGTPVQIPSAAATMLSRATFELIGGYDEGMIIYGGAEPEFGVRAWLSGACVVALPQFEVRHRFKTKPEVGSFLEHLRPAMMHNCLRFGSLYLPEDLAFQMIRYHADLFPDAFPEAVELLEASDVWVRRQRLAETLPRDFEWFANVFALTDQVGREVV